MILFEVLLKNIHLIPQDQIVQWHNINSAVVISVVVESSWCSSKKIMSICASGRGFTVLCFLVRLIRMSLSWSSLSSTYIYGCVLKVSELNLYKMYIETTNLQCLKHQLLCQQSLTWSHHLAGWQCPVRVFNRNTIPYKDINNSIKILLVYFFYGLGNVSKIHHIEIHTKNNPRSRYKNMLL